MSKPDLTRCPLLIRPADGMRSVFEIKFAAKLRVAGTPACEKGLPQPLPFLGAGQHRCVPGEERFPFGALSLREAEFGRFPGDGLRAGRVAPGARRGR